MTLIACSECKKEISDLATACPSCGAPVRTPAARVEPPRKGTSPWTIIGWVIVLLLVLPLATCFLGIAGGQYGEYKKRAEAAQQQGTKP